MAGPTTGSLIVNLGSFTLALMLVFATNRFYTKWHIARKSTVDDCKEIKSTGYGSTRKADLISSNLSTRSGRFVKLLLDYMRLILGDTQLGAIANYIANILSRYSYAVSSQLED